MGKNVFSTLRNTSSSGQYVDNTPFSELQSRIASLKNASAQRDFEDILVYT